MNTDLYTIRQYPCGCRAEGHGDVPPYCSKHDAQAQVRPLGWIGHPSLADPAITHDGFLSDCAACADVDVEERARGNFNISHGIDAEAWDRLHESEQDRYRDAARRQIRAEKASVGIEKQEPLT